MADPTGHHNSQATATSGGLGGPTSVTKAQLGAGVRSIQAPDLATSPTPVADGEVTWRERGEGGPQRIPISTSAASASLAATAVPAGTASAPPPAARVEPVVPSIRTIDGPSAEPDDFEVFFDQVFPRAVRVARRLVGDPNEAEDLAAEAFARAYARWPSVRKHAAPEGWVLRATINLAIDSLRKGKRTPEMAAVDGPEDIIALRVTLAAAMGSLSRRQREIVSLRYLADLSEQDVAAALAITPGSVKTHLSRALDRMRRVLGPQAEEVADGLDLT